MLNEPVEYRRDSKLPLPSPRLRYGYPSYRLGPVGAIEQGFLLSRLVFLEMLRKLFDGHPIDSGSASVAPNLPERTPEVVRLQHTFQKIVLDHRSVLSP